jgi:hypothetical protein
MVNYSFLLDHCTTLHPLLDRILQKGPIFSCQGWEELKKYFVSLLPGIVQQAEQPNKRRRKTPPFAFAPKKKIAQGDLERLNAILRERFAERLA